MTKTEPADRIQLEEVVKKLENEDEENEEVFYDFINN